LKKKSKPKEPVKRGRPDGFNEKVGDRILALAEKGLIDDEIAVKIGVSPRTLDYWKAKDKDFLRSIRESKALADDLVEAALFQRAVGYSHSATKMFQHEGCIIKEDYTEMYPPDTKAIEFWLKNRQPDKWREKKLIEHSGKVGLAEMVIGSFDEAKEEKESEDEDEQSED